MYPELKTVTQAYGAHCIDEDDITEVCHVLRENNLTCGDYVARFEESLCKLTQAKYAVVCSNGTSALHLATTVLGVKESDYVIVPSITFVATANAPRYCGANIIFSDVDPDNGLISVSALKDAIKRSPRKPVAVYPVDLAGQPSCTEEFKSVCDDYEIKIIQDSSHALGTTFKANGNHYPIGCNKFSDCSTFSLHAVKNITSGEGGLITTNDKKAYEKLLTLRSHSMLRNPKYFLNRELGFDCNNQPNPWYYEMQELGFNYRLTDIQAALGLSQIKKIEKFKKIRKKLKETYDEALAPYDKIIRPIKEVESSDPFWHLYVVLINYDNINRADLMRRLSDMGIGTQVHYIPIHLQPYYHQLNKNLRLDGALDYYSKTLSLPLHVHLSESDVHHVVNAILNILEA